MLSIEKIYSLITQNGQFCISTDTRTISLGDIYIGIKGENFDGNLFAEEAISKGASFAIVESGIFKESEQILLVESTRVLLEELAHYHRKKFNIPIIAIGGSNGKTTTKELINSVLSKKYKTHVTKGNLNNDIGVPLTLLGMPKSTEIAIIEIGANHRHEHELLLKIVEPTYVLVTNNGADHLEGFGSIEGARMANKEIYNWAKENNAISFVNKNIPDLVEDSVDCKKIIYPKENYLSNSSIYASLIYKDEVFETSLFGSYNEPNILASIAVGEHFDIEISKIKLAIKEYIPTLKRSQLLKNDNYTIVLDCYNANPSSMELALKDFFSQTPNGKRIIIIGDMFELGKEENKSHNDVLALLESLIKSGDETIVVGPRFYHNSKGYSFNFFENSEEARKHFNNLDLENKFIFVKASRGTKIEEVIKEKVPL